LPHPKDIEAEVTFLPTQAGGRHTPALSGYRPQFYYDGLDWDALQFYPDVGQVNPGDTVRVHLTFLRPEAHAGKIKPGTLFLIREGQRTVGYGQVINFSIWKSQRDELANENNQGKSNRSRIIRESKAISVIRPTLLTRFSVPLILNTRFPGPTSG
jgi:Elongation factor Tu C-terminal domain